jgi:hypothetical protein
MTGVPLRAFGADQIEESSGEELALFCPVPRAWRAWTARTRRAAVRPEHPGTAVAWADRIFEVRTADPLAGGGVRHGLAPWGGGPRRLARGEPARSVLGAFIRPMAKPLFATARATDPPEAN